MINYTLSSDYINKDNEVIGILFIIAIPLLSIILCFISLVTFNYYIIYKIISIYKDR